MKIYQYTSIDVLKLILENKTIRFKKLDLVDDIDESDYCFEPIGFNPSKYFFVSCWTKEKHEL